MVISAKSVALLAELKALRTEDFPQDVEDTVESVLSDVNADDDHGYLSSALLNSGSIYGRTGNTSAITELLGRFHAITEDVRYDLHRYLLNAAGVNGDIEIAWQSPSTSRGLLREFLG
jgi:hypothetical protein